MVGLSRVGGGELLLGVRKVKDVLYEKVNFVIHNWVDYQHWRVYPASIFFLFRRSFVRLDFKPRGDQSFLKIR